MSSQIDPTDPAPSADADFCRESGVGEPSHIKQSRIISTVLSPAVRFWVRSQLEQVEDLHLTIEAGDRQILSGAIDRVSVSTHRAIYRGIHLSQISLIAQKIRTNLGQVLRGKHLQLLSPFPVKGEVVLSESDLNASLSAPLLAQAIADFLLIFLKSADDEPDVANQSIQLHNPQIKLGNGQATLSASLMSASGTPTTVAIRTGLRLESGNKLMLDRPQWLPHANARQGLALKDLDGYTFYLGDVCLDELTLEPGQIRCRGQVTVTPEG